MNIVLWIVQILLAAMFGMAGVSKWYDECMTPATPQSFANIVFTKCTTG